MLYASVSQLKNIYMYKLFSVKGGDMVGGSERRGTKVHIGRTRNSFQFNNELTEIRMNENLPVLRDTQSSARRKMLIPLGAEVKKLLYSKSPCQTSDEAPCVKISMGGFLIPDKRSELSFSSPPPAPRPLLSIQNGF